MPGHTQRDAASRRDFLFYFILFFGLRKRKQVRCEFALGVVTPLKHTSATKPDAKSHPKTLGVAGPLLA